MDTKEPELNVDLWLDDYRKDMPQNAIIIATSYQHGFIVLISSGDDAGVYYWDHSYEYPRSNDESNTYFIAGSFTEFINKVL